MGLPQLRGPSRIESGHHSSEGRFATGVPVSRMRNIAVPARFMAPLLLLARPFLHQWTSSRIATSGRPSTPRGEITSRLDQNEMMS